MRSFLGGIALAACVAAAAMASERRLLHSFERLQLSDQFFGEGANYGDLNRDGAQDIVSGPYWYAGPDFTERFEVYPAVPYDINGYSDNFFVFIHDVNGDQWPDIIVVGFPGKEAWWFQNPQGERRHWDRHLVFPEVDNESPTLTDITGDGQPELVFHTAGRLGYALINRDDPTVPWSFHAISPDRGYTRFTHGLGVGDVNSDGRPDILERNGWWEQPEDDSIEESWTFHAMTFSQAGGAQMFAHDVDGDGDNDVITSKAAHGYGLAWFENVPDNGQPTFREHLIMGEQPEQNDYGVVFSQLHALALIDMDLDGIDDIVTGKRFWAHQGKDPGGHDPVVSYWFKTVREDEGVRFIPYRIDMNSGVGTQVVVGHINNDTLPDVVVGNKKGTLALIHHAREVDEATWHDAQPQRNRTAPAPVSQNTAEASQPAKAIKATSADGRVLNLDLEARDLRDWSATGDAFNDQPIWGDTVHERRRDSVSGHSGNRWIGTYERAGDRPQGTLTSTTFPVSHPYAVFYVGGGRSNATRAEIVLADTNEVIFQASGRNREQMRPVITDLREYVGNEIFVRLVDQSSDGWGHINFDHFRFYGQKPQISPLVARILKADVYPHAGLSADEAVRAMKLPDGFSIRTFASEPDVKQPIAMTLDDRGRVWIAEAYEYPHRAPDGEGQDRILIFEDTDGDGRFDNRKVFAAGLNLVSGLEVGFGGVWVGAAPYLLFIPDRDGDDRPDAEPQVLLDGWGYEDTHETLNAFIWGPDGWLYGCHGVFTHSRVGKPGTPDRDRTPFNAAIWRYHPTRHEFDVFAHGTSNPWGVDFSDHGQAMCTACVIPHLFHIIQGARYHRQAGNHFNPYTYADIKTIADHLHYLGDTPHAGNLKSDDAGGGHAHAGAMIYLGGTWPAEYRNQIIMNNIHGQRLNADILSPQGSGYVGRHGPDFLLTQDYASQMLYFRYGPDGQVYIIDWYDMQACHLREVEAHDRSNGRIYKVNYGDAEAVRVDLQELSDPELAELMLEKNDWYVRHARRILQERAAHREISERARERLSEIALAHADETRRLRAMWALHVTGGLSDDEIAHLLEDSNQYVRGWAIQLALDQDEPSLDKLVPRFESMARSDPSPVVRLYLASAMPRLPSDACWNMLTGLANHTEDADDHNLPLMYWYAAEALVEDDPERALAFGLSCGKTIPQLRSFMLRRIASLDSPSSLKALISALGDSRDRDQQQTIIASLQSALAGRRRVEPPSNWRDVYDKIMKNGSLDLRRQATALGVTFGDQSALAELRKLLDSPQSDSFARREALKVLLSAKDPHLASTLQRLVKDSGLRDVAVTGLAAYDDPRTPPVLLAAYADLSLAEKRIALATLASRVSYAMPLLTAIAEEQIAAADLSADLVRQLHNLKHAEVDALLTDVWGRVRNTAEDKAELIADYQQLLKSPPELDPDLSLGRAIFAKTCQNCHALYGVGDNIGPDITGSNRANLDYLLSNLIDPSALVAKEYQTTVIVTNDGRVITGVVSAENDHSITIRNATETLILPKVEIDERTLGDTSIMPEDQLKQFSPHHVRSLIAYLQGSSQVPLLATAENASLLFNGRDLTGWTGDPELWTVEDGQIVGRSPGIRHNSFLISDLAAEDFHLTLEVKLIGDEGNSGIQFRSQPLSGYNEVKGHQADVGPGWWGKLYEEQGRALLWDRSGEEHVKKGEWNQYEIHAEGSRIRTWINGELCVDLDDPDGARRGNFALQLHAGGPMEVRFRNLELEVVGE